MDDKKYEKWVVLGGIVFVVLAVIGAFMAGSPPKVSDPDGKIIKFTKDNQDALRCAAYLAGLSMVVFLFFLGAVGSRLRRAGTGSGRLAATAVMGGVALAAIAGASNGISAYGALHPGESALTYRLTTVLFGFVAFAAVVFTEATSIVIVRTKFLPAWLGWFGGLVALLWLVGAAAVSTENDTIFTVGFVAFLAWALWIIALSVTLFRTTDSAPAA
ncbi:MAG: hypothetical protein MUP97_12170 [Acidimicrobiia bacterium]|jgi:hypothetical protein|nr:hypothetical protein [Acidimicrobiia bacterium]